MAQVPLQALLPQVRVAMFIDEHTAPQLPQLSALLVVFNSQPSPTVPLQFAAPESQVEMEQAIPLQVAVATDVRLSQSVPQPPQLALSLFKSYWQPLVRLSLAQFEYPAKHVPLHWPPLQLAVMWFVEHAMLQPPQWLAFVLPLSSQPVPESLSQFR